MIDARLYTPLPKIYQLMLTVLLLPALSFFVLLVAFGLTKRRA